MAALFPAKVEISETAFSRRRQNPSQGNSSRRGLIRVSLSASPRKAGTALRGQRWRIQTTISPFSAAGMGGEGEKENSSMSISLLRRFFEINSGKWAGSFYVSFFSLFAMLDNCGSFDEIFV